MRTLLFVFFPAKGALTELALELLAGALGRVPSHSVRAPRPLVTIQREQETGEQTDRSNPNDDNVRTPQLVVVLTWRSSSCCR